MLHFLGQAGICPVSKEKTRGFRVFANSILITYAVLPTEYLSAKLFLCGLWVGMLVTCYQILSERVKISHGNGLEVGKTISALMV